MLFFPWHFGMLFSAAAAASVYREGGTIIIPRRKRSDREEKGFSRLCLKKISGDKNRTYSGTARNNQHPAISFEKAWNKKGGIPYLIPGVMQHWHFGTEGVLRSLRVINVSGVEEAIWKEKRRVDCTAR